MIEWIVFSKNRACQLDLLLRSMDMFVPKEKNWATTVIYKTTTNFHEDAYKKLKKEHKFVNFIEETSFQHNFEEVIDETYAEFIGTLTDDDVFIRKLPDDVYFNQIYSPKALQFSLRLSPDMNYCYPFNRAMIPTNKTEWDWTELDIINHGDYAYPVSLSGSIWQKRHIKRQLSKLKGYANPNELEQRMYDNRIVSLNLLNCLPENCTVTVPHNRVQDIVHNRSFNGDADKLNMMFLADFRIDIRPLINLKSNSPFYEYDYRFFKIR